MNSSAQVHLLATPQQQQRLLTLQEQFAAACNFLSERVRAHRCWNRVALHHLTYKELRLQFPALGSQMACNAIYSVCKAARAVYQGRDSPHHIALRPDAPLPLLRFPPDAPVWFDRHTLSIKQGVASLFTLDGRMKFQLSLQPELEQRFHHERLREIVLSRQHDVFTLTFYFAIEGEVSDASDTVAHRYNVVPVAGAAPHLPDANRQAH